MTREEILRKTIATNIPNYYVTDEDCENLYYKAMGNHVNEVLLGPSSYKIAEKFSDKEMKTGISISYPAGTAYPEVKAEEIRSFEKENGSADAYYVTAAVGYFMSGHEDNLRDEIKLCVQATEKPVYFFIEAAEMEDRHLDKVCQTAREMKAAGIVISTAFMPYAIRRGTAEEVKRMKKYAGSDLEVIAFGTFDTVKKAEEALEAGADKIILNGIDMLIY